ncbi:MAG: hypothetical protein KAS67_01250 [Thermoplasmata archaeon]|nr:hypothetical protein [Thermoplasmata archaeon]
MKMKKIIGFAIVITFIFSMAAANTCFHDASEVQMDGTRQGVIGWQHADFADNLEVDFSPIKPKPTDAITITITSLEPDITIQMAIVDITVIFPLGSMSTGSRSFQRISETEMKIMIGPYEYNGTSVTFFINAYDYNNVPMQSPAYTIEIVGEERTGGWTHLTFDSNIKLTQTPAAPNASEPVMITIESIEGVPIEGANLYFIYTPVGGSTESGGWAFDRLNFTAMEREISANFHPAGANISYWVVVWDEYSELTKSEPFNYSIPGVVEFNYPFEYTVEDIEGNVDNSEWYPDTVIIMSMAGIAMLALPLFAYLYMEEKRKLEKTESLMAKEKDKKDNSKEDGAKEEEEKEAGKNKDGIFKRKTKASETPDAESEEVDA